MIFDIMFEMYNMCKAVIFYQYIDGFSLLKVWIVFPALRISRFIVICLAMSLFCGVPQG